MSKLIRDYVALPPKLRNSFDFWRQKDEPADDRKQILTCLWPLVLLHQSALSRTFLAPKKSDSRGSTRPLEKLRNVCGRYVINFAPRVIASCYVIWRRISRQTCVCECAVYSNFFGAKTRSGSRYVATFPVHDTQ